MSIITRLINKIKKQIVRPRPVEGRVKNTPWRGRKAKSGERGANVVRTESRSILWVIPGLRRDVVMILEVANG